MKLRAMKTCLACSGLILILILMFPTPAEARYLDPTTGSMVLQIVVGGILAGMATIKLSWKRIKSFFQRTAKE
jgi:hypothetical protein